MGWQSSMGRFEKQALEGAKLYPMSGRITLMTFS